MGEDSKKKEVMVYGDIEGLEGNHLKSFREGRDPGAIIPLLRIL
jgi:hypothetical protein